MKKNILSFAIGLVAIALGLFASSDTSDAAFHWMRVYAVMAGANGTSDIQYVELRMTHSGQNFVAGHDICFFDATGAPYARFTFPSDVVNDADEASILVGTTEFDAAWTAGSPDDPFFVAVTAENTVKISNGSGEPHPVRGPSGKVSFGTDSATIPSAMCQGNFFPIDSLAYGTGYAGPVDHVAKLNVDLPNTGTQAAVMQGPICLAGSPSPCPPPWEPRNNSEDYALVNVNDPDTNNPRNNAGEFGDITPDADGDGVPDASDNCPVWPNTGQGLPNTWTVPSGDSDCDGFPDSVNSGGRGRESFMVTDPVDWCADTTTPNDEQGPGAGEPLSPWPPDFNDNRVTDLSDISLMSSSYNKAPPDPLYEARKDLNANNAVDLSDISVMSPFYNKTCVP
jgi:hypothetical protein